MLKVANRTLLEHNLENLRDFASEVIIVVGYKKNLIRKYIGNDYKNLKIRYAEQKQQLGTGNALLAVEKYVKNEFILLNGDDIYPEENIKKIMAHKYSILVKEIENPKAFGVAIQKNNILLDLIEKPEKFVSDLTNTGLYKLDKKIFSIIKKLKKSKRGEYEITDAIKALATNEKIYCVKAKKWLPIVYSWDLLKADQILRRKKNLIGSKSKIPGTVKNSSIGDNCVIKGNIQNSIIMDKTVIDNGSIVKNSIIGENVYFSGRASGAIIADNSKLFNVEIKNCKISPYKTIRNKKIGHDV